MPIAFESIQDPLGIASSGTLLGKMMFEGGQARRQQQAYLQRDLLKNQLSQDQDAASQMMKLKLLQSLGVIPGGGEEDIGLISPQSQTQGTSSKGPFQQAAPSPGGVPQERVKSFQGQPTTPQGFQAKNLTDAQIAQVSVIDPSLGKTLLEQRKSERDLEAAQRRNDIAERKASLQERKFEYEVGQEEIKPSKEYSTELTNRYQNILENEPIYKLLESSADDRGVLSSIRAWATNYWDIPSGLLMNPTEEAINKVAAMTTRGVSKYFNGRILESEIRSQILSNPSLLNSPEGQRMLAKLTLEMDSIVKNEYEAMKDIIKENKGKVPKDLQIKILEKTTKYANASFERARNIMKGEDKVLPPPKPGEKINRKQIDYLIKKHNNDLQAAKREAEDMGYGI